jgi:hypothetical protein
MPRSWLAVPGEPPPPAIDHLGEPFDVGEEEREPPRPSLAGFALRPWFDASDP